MRDAESHIERFIIEILKQSNLKRVLVLGDLDNAYIKGFITRFLKPCGFVVDVKTDMNTFERRSKCEKIAKELGVRIIERNELVITKKLNSLQKNKIIKPIATALKGALYFFYSVQSKCRGGYDFVHVHYLYYEVLRHAWRYKTANCKMIASWWGSDLLRKSDNELEKCWRYLKDFDLVTTDSIDLEKAYFDRVVKNRNANAVYKRLYLGSEVADSINLQINNTDRILKGKTIDKDKVVIAIGYNASKAQQHLKVVDALSDLDLELKKKIVVVLQMTYGIEDSQYLESVVTQARNAGFETVLYDTYLSNEEVANIRIVTDIFINAQTTDAFCSTIKEYMYAKTALINASWLEYIELKEWNLYTLVFDEFSEIKGIVEGLMKEKDTNRLEKNREIIGNKFGWEGCAQKWCETYGEI